MASKGKKNKVPITKSVLNAKDNTDRPNNDLANDKYDCGASDSSTTSSSTEAAGFSGSEVLDPKTVHNVCVFLKDFVDDMSGAFLIYEYFIEGIMMELRNPNLSTQRKATMNAHVKLFQHHLSIIIRELRRVKRRESNALTATSNSFALTEEGSKDELIPNYKYVVFVIYEEAMKHKKKLGELFKSTEPTSS
ncbi:uncharacterized protein LOC115440554 [Manduca sexta]|uniref:Uncharacterized protein n=1 Tax=Manduca sexta TaxID=7130 RepID=A0A921YU41_MANSE|nr:uncharacterized protein LOC115440554 [Manduca sexta]KAG6445572.1 hypothetical protein O3G_MSEX004011 [Manduca sexta]